MAGADDYTPEAIRSSVEANRRMLADHQTECEPCRALPPQRGRWCPYGWQLEAAHRQMQKWLRQKDAERRTEAARQQPYGSPCAECLELFGPRLRPAAEEVGADQAAAAYAERDAYVAEILAARRDGWLSPVCRITPHKHRNHTACNFKLCTCACHRGRAS